MEAEIWNIRFDIKMPQTVQLYLNSMTLGKRYNTGCFFQFGDSLILNNSVNFYRFFIPKKAVESQ